MSPRIVPTLVADAYRVGIMVHAVGTDHPFRSSRLYLSVATHHVVIPYTEFPSPLSVPRIDLRRRARLPWPHRRTMNHYQCNRSHNAPMQEVVDSAVRNAVSAATMIFTVSSIIFFFIIYFKSYFFFCRAMPCWYILTFSGAEKEAKRHPPPLNLPLWGDLKK